MAVPRLYLLPERLRELIEKAAEKQLSEKDIADQRCAFVFGQLPENHQMSKEDIRQALEKKHQSDAFQSRRLAWAVQRRHRTRSSKDRHGSQRMYWP